MLYTIATANAGFDLAGGFASNGYGAPSPGGHSLAACLTLRRSPRWSVVVVAAVANGGILRSQADKMLDQLPRQFREGVFEQQQG